MYDYWDEAPEERISPSANPVLATFNKEAAKDISQSVLTGVFGKKAPSVSDVALDVRRYQSYVQRYPQPILYIY